MSPAVDGAHPHVGLPPEQFAAAFPFHFAVDSELSVVQVGATLRRVCPDVVPGARIADLFRPVRPEQGELTPAFVHENRSRFFLLAHRAGDLQLRGAFVELPGQSVLLFLGSPWFTDAAEIAARGLGYDDFAVHDPVVDLLQVFQASKIALADAKKLAAKLDGQRTELRAANARLREQEAEFRKLALIAERTDNAVVLADAGGVAQWVNAGFTRLTGYAPEEIVGRKPGHVLQGRDTDPATVARIRAHLQRGEGFREEILNYRRDGREYWSALEVQPIRDETGAVANFMSIQSDITERRAAQQRQRIQFEVAQVLAEAEHVAGALLRILEIVCLRLGWPAGQVWRVVGDRLRFVDAHSAPTAQVAEFIAASRAIEFAPGDGILSGVWSSGKPRWVPDVTREARFRRADAALSNGLRGAFAFPVLVNGHTWGVLELYSRRVERPDEELLQAFATIGIEVGQFIARRQAEQAQRRGEERFRAAFEDAHAGMAISTADNRTLSVNRALCEMLGYTEAELIGRAPIELTHPEDVAATAMASERIRRGESDVIELEKRFVRKDGGIVWTILRVRRHRGRDGNPDLLIAHILDITRRKAAEREIAAERKLLDEAREREVATGQEIQRSLLIGALPAGLSCADIAGFAEASRGIDGDFYGFTTFRPDCFEVLIGDVMGKGIPAALVGAGVRATYHQVVTERLAASVGRDGLPPPAEIMNGLHRSLTPRLIGLDTFVTMALYRFDVAAGTMTYVNAGHTAGVLMHPDGRITPLLGENPPMGVVEDEHYVELTVEVAAGDALTVYSDGITEARGSSGAMFGERRLHDFLVAAARQPLPASTCLQALRKVVGDFAGGAPLADDQMAVMVRLLPLAGSRGEDIGQGEAEVFDLPWSAAGLEPLRRRVAAAAAWLGEDAADRLVLAAFEAATNVVRHVPRPSPEATLACRITPAADRVSVEIWYIGLPFERQPEPHPDLSGESEGGFGLYIIDRAVSEVAYESPLLDVCCTRLVQIAESSVAG